MLDVATTVSQLSRASDASVGSSRIDLTKRCEPLSIPNISERTAAASDVPRRHFACYSQVRSQLLRRPAGLPSTFDSRGHRCRLSVIALLDRVPGSRSHLPPPCCCPPRRRTTP